VAFGSAPTSLEETISSPIEEWKLVQGHLRPMPPRNYEPGHLLTISRGKVLRTSHNQL
jgi:hypothetical protein